MLQGRTGSEGHDRVLAVLQENAASLLKIARRHSLCDDDAQDAYQRGLEIYLHRLDRVDPATAGAWLRTVVKHEAMAIREQRVRTLQSEDVDFDALVAGDVSTGEERAVAFDRVTRAAEALRGCKRDEVAAMVLKADGHSYDEICSVTGWTYTKVNRCLREGRSRFLARYAAIESGEECRRIAPLLSLIVDGEATPVQMAEARPHLRNCAACRTSLRELTESQAAIHAAFPAAILLGATGAPDGLLVRAYEALVVGVHDRLALAALKAQHAVETVSATKLAAVAASAAAVAGGGAVAVDQARTAPAPAPERAAVRRPPAARPTPEASPVARAPRVAAPARPVAVARAAEPRARRARVTADATPAPVTSTVRPRQEFGFESARAAPPATVPAKAKTEDFGFER